jgi:hypothetical protein
MECEEGILTFIYDVIDETEVIESYRFDLRWEEKFDESIRN